MFDMFKFKVLQAGTESNRRPSDCQSGQTVLIQLPLLRRVCWVFRARESPCVHWVIGQLVFISY